MELLLSLLHQQDVGGKTEWISANEDRYIDQRQIRKQVKSANNLAVQSNLVTHGLPGNRCVMAPREGDDATRRV